MKLLSNYLIGNPCPNLQEILEKHLVHIGRPSLASLLQILGGVDPTPQTLDPSFIQHPTWIVLDLLLAALGLITSCVWGAQSWRPFPNPIFSPNFGYVTSSIFSLRPLSTKTP